MIKNSIKSVLLVTLSICMVVMSSCAVAEKETVDFFSDSEEIQNVYTVGEVDISLYEEGAVAFSDGSYGQTYDDIVPGAVYPKAPTVTVEEGSLESYVRMIVTVKFKNAIDESCLGDKLDAIFLGKDAGNWILNAKTVVEDNTSVVYEYRYATTVSAPEADVVLEPIFTDVTFDGTIWGNELLYFDGMQIAVEGHAIEAFSFANADEAWASFGG